MTYIIKGILSDDSKKSIISGIVQDLDKDKKFTLYIKSWIRRNIYSKVFRSYWL